MGATPLRNMLHESFRNNFLHPCDCATEVEFIRPTLSDLVDEMSLEIDICPDVIQETDNKNY
jgi:hypothetical protein